jgi:hypothetical protein
MIYCAWLAELALFGIWKIAGLAGVFALRYAFVLGAAAFQWDLARRCGVARGALFWLVLLIATASSYVGTLPKPELFSFFFFNLLVWLLFRAKLSARRGGKAGRWLAVLPVLVLVWANTHGAFILASPLIAAFVAGEAIHARRGRPDARLPFRPLLISATLCAAATACTPYGLAYPAQLIADNVLHRTARPDGVWNAAYQSIASHTSWQFGFPVLLLAMLGIFGIAGWRRMRAGRMDWSAAIAVTAYAVLFTVYLRTTYFLPAVFAAGTFFLLRADAERGAVPLQMSPRLGLACLVAFCTLAAHSLFQSLLRPATGSWAGFGIGGNNPVDAADFLARRTPSNPRLINLFNTGGYLLWRLWPRYEVMVDSRSFPYLSWFEDQYRFGSGEDFEAFLKKYPAPLAVIDLDRTVVWLNFLRSAEWKPVFYGPAAIIFQRAEMAGDAPLQTIGDLHMRNAETALNLFTFARFVGDYRTAWSMEEQLRRPWLAWQLSSSVRRSVHAYREAHDALRAGRFDEAENLFSSAMKDWQTSEREKLILSLFFARKAAAQDSSHAGERATIEAGLRGLAAPGSSP